DALRDPADAAVSRRAARRRVQVDAADAPVRFQARRAPRDGRARRVDWPERRVADPGHVSRALPSGRRRARERAAAAGHGLPRRVRARVGDVRGRRPESRGDPCGPSQGRLSGAVRHLQPELDGGRRRRARAPDARRRTVPRRARRAGHAHRHVHVPAARPVPRSGDFRGDGPGARAVLPGSVTRPCCEGRMDERPRVGRPRGRGWLPLVVLVSLAPFSCLLTTPRIFYVRDLSFFFWSRHLWLRHTILSGQAPWWDPYVAAGQSAIADALNQIVMPITLAIRLVPSDVVSFNLWVALPLPIAAAG